MQSQDTDNQTKDQELIESELKAVTDDLDEMEARQREYQLSAAEALRIDHKSRRPKKKPRVSWSWTAKL